MANYRQNQFSYSFAQPVHLFATINFGASGAPSIAANTGMGIASITRSSAGVFVITLTQAYNGLLGVEKSNLNSTAPAAPSMYISSNAVTTASAPTITLVMNSAGTATDPASGEAVLLDIKLQKSSIRY